MSLSVNLKTIDSYCATQAVITETGAHLSGGHHDDVERIKLPSVRPIKWNYSARD